MPSGGNLIAEAFKDKTVVVTGHTGFKGTWLTIWLKLLGAKVVGISLNPITSPSHFSVANVGDGITDLRIDVRNQEELEQAIIHAKPDFVFHLAAQALVSSAYSDPSGTWQTNVMGTVNVLESLRKISNKCAAVMITSDKCYENVEWVWGYRETDRLGGADPYSASKAAAELAISFYVKSYFPSSTTNVRIASARAGNVIGGGDWSENRIVPDCVRAWAKGDIANLRNPNATRPWQHVLEPISGYLSLAISLSKSNAHNGEAFNFGPNLQKNHTVLDLVSELGKNWQAAKWNVLKSNTEAPYESGLLKLNCDKALQQLNWQAVLSFEETASMTAEWYKFCYSEKENIRKFSESQIELYQVKARALGFQWAL